MCICRNSQVYACLLCHAPPYTCHQFDDFGVDIHQSQFNMLKAMLQNDLTEHTGAKDKTAHAYDCDFQIVHVNVPIYLLVRMSCCFRVREASRTFARILYPSACG